MIYLGEPRKMKESEIQKQILDYLKGRGYFAERMPLGGVQMNVGGNKFMRKNPLSGFPDLFFFSNNNTVYPKFVGIEVKTLTGKQSNIQKEWEKKLTDIGVLYFLARSVDDVIKFLKEKDL